MATEEQKMTKRVKIKKNTKNKSKTGQDSELDMDGLEDSKEKSVLKKKLKIKPKSDDKVEPKPKLSQNSEKMKVVDERLINVSFEPKPKIETEKQPKAEQVGDERIYYLTGKGKSHPVHELTQKLRTILLNSGFNELENQYFVDEKDIFDQYNTKSGIVLDKTYYLGENQRQKIEVTADQLKQIQEMISDSSFNSEKFLEIFNQYNKNVIEFPGIFKKIIDDFDITDNDLNKILEILPQLRTANPRLKHTTLRSTMGLSWIETLAAIFDRENLPIKVFSTGVWFKRESKQTDLNLQSHYGASCIIIDDEITVNNGKVIVEEILEQLGLKDLEFKEIDLSRHLGLSFKELEVYNNDIKIATCGRFSKKILKKYGIDLPVLFINFGLEHIVMVQKGIDDIRELMYPQFHRAWKLNDQDIAMAIQYIQIPKTKLGNEIASSLYQICESNLSKASPCEFVVWEGMINTGPSQLGDYEGEIEPATAVKLKEADTERIKHEESADIAKIGEIAQIAETAKTTKTAETAGTAETTQDKPSTVKKRLVVKVVKRDKDSKLCGPAALNEIVVKNGDIFGVQNPKESQELSGAVKTNIKYLDAFSKYVGRQIELKLSEGEFTQLSQIKAGIIKDMEDINLQLDSRAVRFIITNNKKIDVRGPMFVNVEYSFENLEDEIKNEQSDEKDKNK